MSSEIFFLVASFVKKSFRIEIVDMLSDLKMAHPLLKCETVYCEAFRVSINVVCDVIGLKDHS